MINFDKELKTDLISAVVKLVNAEIKLLMYNRLVGMFYKEKLDVVLNHICVLFDIISTDDKNDLKQEIKNYWDEMKLESNKHTRDAMKDDWTWLD